MSLAAWRKEMLAKRLYSYTPIDVSCWPHTHTHTHAHRHQRTRTLYCDCRWKTARNRSFGLLSMQPALGTVLNYHFTVSVHDDSDVAPAANSAPRKKKEDRIFQAEKLSSAIELIVLIVPLLYSLLFALPELYQYLQATQKLKKNSVYCICCTLNTVCIFYTHSSFWNNLIVIYVPDLKDHSMIPWERPSLSIG